MDRLAKHVHGDNRKLSFAFLLSMPGAPYIYYGDELGMNYVEGLTSVEGGYGRTGSRSPMQWDDSINAGFSAAASDKLYIPLDPSADRTTAEKEMSDDNSLRSEVKKLIAVRQAHTALQSTGEIEFVCDGAPGKPLAYLRSFEDEKILVVINPTDTPYETDLFKGEIIYAFGKVTVSEERTAVGAHSAVFMKV